MAGAGANKTNFTARDVAMTKALADPTRHRIWIILSEREASPKELAEELGIKLHTAMYHVAVLAGRKHIDYPLIELVATDTKGGGATIHIYKAIDNPVIGIDEAAEQSQEDREDSSAFIVPRMVKDLLLAQEGGSIDTDPERSLLRYHDLFDKAGMLRLAELAMRVLQEQEDIAVESQERIARGESEAIPIAMHTSMFRVRKLYDGEDRPT